MLPEYRNIPRRYCQLISRKVADMTISPAQSRAARAMLEYSQADLAEKAGVSERTILDFERGARRPNRATLFALRWTLEGEGIEFIDGEAPGVRLRR